ncbi:MAG: hypothetical protein M1490_04680 [Candidatus Bathyarchaeota archaeon]|nr:hypothetical protein [Candidatus Bathyarchaeota archaeon]
MSEPSEKGKDELLVSDEFYHEIEKYAKQTGKTPKEFMEDATKNYLQELKKVYPNKTPKEEAAASRVLCPSGCGTALEKRKFVEIFATQPESTEDLYCPKCHLRWMSEQHSDLLETGRTKTEVNIPGGEMVLLQQLAKAQGKDVNQIISQIISEKILEDKGEPLIFEENGVTYERLSIDLPKTVSDFYRYIAHSKGKDDLMETLITFDLIDHLNSQIQGITPESLKDLFNLDSGLTDMANREDKIFKD